MLVDKFEDEVMGNEMYRTQLSSGMEAFFLPLNPKLKIQMMHVYTRFGSIDAKFLDPELGKEVEVEDGTAHFLEHCAFYDDKGKDALQWFGKHGIQGNAWTSFDHTTYYYHSPGQYKKRDLDFLISFVTNPFITDEVVKKEKKVIDQEIARRNDVPNYLVFKNLQRALLKEHPFRRSISGNQETIKRITKEYLHSAYNTFYHPSNLKLVMFVPSNNPIVDAIKYFELAEKINNSKGFSQKQAPEYVYINEPAEVGQKRIKGRHKVPEPLVLIAFKGNMSMEGTDDERLRIDVLNDLLVETIFSRSSEAVYDLAKRKIIRPDIFNGYNYSGRGFGLFGVSGSIDDADKFEEGMIKMIKEQVNGAMSRELFDIVKITAINDQTKAFELESPQSLQSNVIHSLAAGYNPMNYMKILMDVTYEDVLEAGKRYLDTDNYSVSIVEPREK